MKKIEQCPICKSKKQNIFLKSRDYSVSKKDFTIVKCIDCMFLFTNPRPEERDMGDYYISDNYISHTNNKKGLFNYLYQIVRKHAIVTKTKLLINTSATKNHLDIGCGTGEFINSCVKRNINCIGIEPSRIAREKAINNYKLNVKADTDLNQFKNNSFDSVSMWHVLEHIYDINNTISSLKNIIREEGTLIVAVPNHKSLDAKIYKKYWAAWDLPIHLNHFSPITINRLLKNNGFELEKKIGMKFDAFYVALLSNEYKSGKKQFIKAFAIGVFSNLSAILGFSQYSSTIYIFSNKK